MIWRPVILKQRNHSLTVGVIHQHEDWAGGVFKGAEDRELNI